MTAITQPPLFNDLPPMESAPVPGGTPAQRFEAFHRRNPHVYELLLQMAIRLMDRGVKRYSMKGLFEALRWQYSLNTSGEDFKLNNYFTSFYARLLIKEEPKLNGFFETRKGVYVE